MKKKLLLVIMLLCAGSVNAQKEIKAEDIIKLIDSSTVLYCKVDRYKNNFFAKNLELVFYDTSNYKGIFIESNIIKRCVCRNVRCEYIELEYANGFIDTFIIDKDKEFLKKFNRILKETPLQEFKEWYILCHNTKSPSSGHFLKFKYM